jgi:hypothetical protein
MITKLTLTNITTVRIDDMILDKTIGYDRRIYLFGFIRIYRDSYKKTTSYPEDNKGRRKVGFPTKTD